MVDGNAPGSSKIARAVSLPSAALGLLLLVLWTWNRARSVTALTFGGDRARVLSISSHHRDGGSFVSDMVVMLVLVIIASALCAWALHSWWDYGWRSGAHRNGKKLFSALPMLAVIFVVVESALALLTVDAIDGGYHVSDRWAAVIGAVGQLKVLSLFVGWFALFLTVYGSWRFRAITMEPSPATDEVQHGPPDERPTAGSAICLSGGGIRSASFSWGALAELERHRPLRTFDHLYSVSGGGYTGAAFTGAPDALRTAEQFFSDAQTPRPVGIPADLARFDFLRARQRFLANGPGGLVRALGLALLSVSLNLFVVFLGVVVVAVPVGVLAAGELGGNGTDVPSGVWWPVVVVFLMATGGLVLSAAIDSGSRRIGLAIASALAACGAFLAVVRVVMPWLAQNVERVFSGNWWKSIIPAALVWIISLLFTVLKPRLVKAAARLGGLLTLAAVVLASATVTRIVIDPAWHWFRHSSFLDDPQWLLLIAVGLLVTIDFTGAQWWSFHPMYRNRLAGTFAFTSGPNGLRPQKPSEWPTWDDVHQRKGERPQHVVCAATHRRTSEVTGLTSISFTFSADGVEMHEPYRDHDTGKVTVRRYHRDAAWLQNAVGGDRRYLSTRKRATVIAAAAMSGAAVDSSMGRLSMGSTDTLLALLNLRLGVWMPNPRFDVHSRATGATMAFTRPGLRYLFHEVIGHYDTTDPFIHVSDGGHWENLGLVEALRRRHRRIVVIDASGDHFSAAANGSGIGLTTLYEAVDLARIELFTEVKVDHDQFQRLLPDRRTGRCEQNWMTCSVVYHRDPLHNWENGCDDHCQHGEILFVKALVGDRTPESVLSFANADRIFPAYSTGDQFLSEPQFRSLVGLGEAAMNDALHGVGTRWFEGADDTGTEPSIS
jgi:hypothetical protein